MAATFPDAIDPTGPLDDPSRGWFGVTDTANKVSYLCRRLLPVWLAALDGIDPVNLIDGRDWFTAGQLDDIAARLAATIRRARGPLTALLTVTSIPTLNAPAGQRPNPQKWGPEASLLATVMEQLANDISALHPADPQEAPTLPGASTFNPWRTIAAGLRVVNAELGDWWQHLGTPPRSHPNGEGTIVWWSSRFEAQRLRACRRFGARTELPWTLQAPDRHRSMRHALQTLASMPLLDGREQLVLQLAAKAPLADVLDTVTELTGDS